MATATIERCSPHQWRTPDHETDTSLVCLVCLRVLPYDDTYVTLHRVRSILDRIRRTRPGDYKRSWTYFAHIPRGVYKGPEDPFDGLC